MTVLWVARHLINLPDESRVMKRLRNDKLDLDQHLLLDIFDAANRTAYYSAVASRTQMKQQDFNKVIKGAPESRERPVYVKPKKKFASAKEIAMALGGGAA